jgi:hypothetical protein
MSQVEPISFQKLDLVCIAQGKEVHGIIIAGLRITANNAELRDVYRFIKLLTKPYSINQNIKGTFLVTFRYFLPFFLPLQHQRSLT